MHEIINNFIINYKAFFRWLYTAITHLLHEPVSPEMPRNTQQDVCHIMEFLQNFDNIGSKEGGFQKGCFTMEKMGQYLNDAPLTIPPNTDDNLWDNFLSQSDCIRMHPIIIKRNKDYSFIMQFNCLKSSIANIFYIPTNSIASQFSIQGTLNCFKSVDALIHITSINHNKESTCFVLLDTKAPAEGLYFVEISKKNSEVKASCSYFYFQQLCEKSHSSERFHILDVKFYSNSILSVLLQEDSPMKNGILYQFPSTIAREKLQDIDLCLDLTKQFIPKINSFELGCSVIKHLDGLVCSQLAVSGCRRISVVLSENRKKVRLFEMEAEEDDEEDADMTTSVRESDTSMKEERSVIE